ncbi:uncharacterized protein Pyn_13749 [Prunus yedoensis var. nudiflora]|uniref:Uncharacterized protein n=1 Tax=Prunus yedoensis var. nudiflora TaxID=2094558 RepID=A0A314UL89_PRUYE|nr:uncharacterized protein Pyn_13749 [Prunus yedoensis var. nudiflora]
MARNSGILIRQLFGNWSKPCAGLLHHRRKLLPSSIQTLTLTSIPSTTPCLPPPCKLPLSSPNLHFKERSDKGLVFSRPANMVIISSKDDYDRTIKQVKDGLWPAVFYLVACDTTPLWSYSTFKLRRLRQEFPHVTIYKVIGTPVVDMEKMWKYLKADLTPAFHFYLNGEKVGDIRGSKKLQDIFAALYRNVIPVEATQPTGSSGMGERRAEQLVIQAKKYENDKGSVRALSQRRDAAILTQLRGTATLAQGNGGLVEAVESSTAPSLDEVMRAVESLPGGRANGILWWFARGLFKYQPKKRVMFSKVQGLYFKVAWLMHEMAEE